MYQQKPLQKRKRNSIALLLGIIFFLLLGILATIYHFRSDYYKSINTAIDINKTDLQLFQVENNEDMKIMAKRLKADGIIDNNLYFWWYLRSNGLIPKIQAGTHYLAKSYNYEAIATELSKARPKEISITIPEGYRIDQIDAKLTEEELIEAGEFIKAAENFDTSSYDFIKGETLEGYLFPDTYRVFGDNFQNKSLIIKMIKNFNSRISQLYADGDTENSLEEVVIMASIIEKETTNKDNRAIVAGILWRRLEIGMLIGADATTRYALQKFTEPLTYEDLESDSPYNTRKVRGLPPAPICNPGLKSLKAAINPEESDYLYYLHDANGQIHYGKNNEEHNANKREYL